MWKPLGRFEIGMPIIKWKDKIKTDLAAICYGGCVIQ
jgi:hypothetical protein